MNTGEGKIPEIENPRLWRLLIEITRHALNIVGMSTTDDGSLFRCSVPLVGSPDGSLRALEDAVYAVPAILADFGRVDFLVRTDNYIPVPTGLGEEGQKAAADLAHILENGDILMCDPVPEAGVDILWAIPSDLANFIARTFRNPPVMCHITPLLRYFSRKTLLGNSGKLYAHLRPAPDSGVDIIAFDHTLRICCSHRVAGVADASYYILAGMQTAGLDFATDEILLCGDAALRIAAMPVLRRYVRSVMPVIFPSVAFRAGKEALGAPFSLVIMPLCE